ncbi:hypothetical protein P6B95_36920 [Streptomyces atratus]|uniref:hypothetical protein n=1 Tax=Streptomyces atratus TaxID=1893 RepID=UPI001671075C|nr:hypothetical protein [Streptomyces atratus]WPW32415.1 hypothetical protein P6B95_36920 [Streptomyces atratus]
MSTHSTATPAVSGASRRPERRAQPAAYASNATPQARMLINSCERLSATKY